MSDQCFYSNRVAAITGGRRGLVKAMQFLADHGGESHVDDAMMFLTSAQASFITGETLRATGGMAAGV